MTTTATVLLALLFLPLIVLWNLTESKSTKINRARKQGHTWRSIADRYGVSPSTARRWATA